MKTSKQEQILDIEYRDGYGNPRKAHLVLRGRITLICGDSGSGKTYLIEILSDIINNSLLDNTIKLNLDTSQIITITENYGGTLSPNEISTLLLNKLKQYKDKIIFIDEADSRLENNKLLIEFIQQDTQNTYVLMCKTTKLGITPINLAKAVTIGNTTELDYNI